MVWAIGVVAVLVAWAAWTYRPHTYRYKLTVEVATPEGLKTGYAVREVKWRKTPKLTPEAHDSETTQRGQAVAVDLPGGKSLFLLLDANAYDAVFTAFYEVGGGTVPRVLNRARETGTVYTMPPSAEFGKGRLQYRPYPRFVFFHDISDPRTVERVDPEKLAATFGKDVRLKRITAVVTDDPVTTGIERRLGWLDRLADYRGDRSNTFTSVLSNEIGSLRKK